MSGWKKTLLGECCEIVSGSTPSTSRPEFWGDDVYWATPKDLAELAGAYISDTPRKLTRLGLESCAATILPPGSVLFSSRAPIGHTAINTVPMATNQGFKSLVPDSRQVDAEFLYRWLRFKRPYLESLGNGATFKEVSKAVVARVEIELPPLPEQRRIAAILDKADELRAKRRAALAQLDGLAQSVFVEMFGDPIENVLRHPVRHLIDLVDPNRPITYGILKPGPDQPDGVKYIRVVDMKDGGIDPTSIRRTTQTISDSYRRSLLTSGDLLLSIRGHVGRVATVPPPLEGANITQDTARLAPSGVSSVYLRECLRTVALQRWMAQRTKGVAVRGINLTDVKLIPIVVPPESKQSAFADRVEVVDRLRTDQRLSRNASQRLFDALQHQAFAGEL